MVGRSHNLGLRVQKVLSVKQGVVGDHGVSDLVQPLDVVVSSCIGILGGPKRLSVVRITGTTSKVLLLTVVHHW